MSHHWNPTKKEIELLDRNIHEFVVQENKNPQFMKDSGWIGICTERYMKFSFVPSRSNYTSGLLNWHTAREGGSLTIQYYGPRS